ncbi:hypothetical protein DH2020_038945 [Rehmannia glutinosa]|uniref:Protein MIZU-KUSSEI 1 n=1 Tax=Rehmannia glutinosa TaxID=99300 RepID=A0ABR0UYC5_REHGL
MSEVSFFLKKINVLNQPRIRRRLPVPSDRPPWRWRLRRLPPPQQNRRRRRLQFPPIDPLDFHHPRRRHPPHVPVALHPGPDLDRPLPRPENHRNPVRQPPRPRQLRRPGRAQIGAGPDNRAPRHDGGPREGDVVRAAENRAGVREGTATRRREAVPGARWTMYCNGRQCGYAQSRACTESDWHVLSTVQSVSVGAGVIPVVDDGGKGGASEGELLYMRARFERVVGNRDSEAFYMLNPDGSGGPELSIFLLRI